MPNTPCLTLPNGIVLDPHGAGVSLLTDHAARLNLATVRVYVARHPGGYQEYMIVDGARAEYGTPSLEAAAAHLDIMALQRHVREDQA
jgi:hypothetical protein